MRRFPQAGFKPAPDDLFEVFFTLPEPDMAEAMGVSVDLLRAWKDGTALVPRIAYRLARCIAGYLPVSYGLFSNAKCIDGRLVLDAPLTPF